MIPLLEEEIKAYRFMLRLDVVDTQVTQNGAELLLAAEKNITEKTACSKDF
jgi:hypothetical protein